MKLANQSRQLKKVVLSVILAICMVSCKWEDKHFYVEDLGIFIDVERMDNATDEDEEYRIFFYKDAEDRGKDYIDLNCRDRSGLQHIFMYFPEDDVDKIYIDDSYLRAVRHTEASEFDFILLRPKRSHYSNPLTSDDVDEMRELNARTDSVRAIPGTQIQFKTITHDLLLWRQWEDSIGNRIMEDAKLIESIDVNQ